METGTTDHNEAKLDQRAAALAAAGREAAPARAARLAELEPVIEAGLAQFEAVGRALLEIKTDHLYLAHGRYGSFAQYLTQHFKIRRAHGHRLIQAAEIAQELAAMSPIGDIRPEKESQVRPLKELPTPELRGQAWQEAVDTANGSQPTAKEVQAVVERLLPAPTTPRGPAKLSTVAKKLIDTYSPDEIRRLIILLQKELG